MNDEPIIEFLRSRARVEPPIGLTQRVMAEIASTQAQRSWFAAMLPATAVMAMVAVVIVVGLLVTRPPNLGPPASGSPSVFPQASSSATPSATPAPSLASRTPAPTTSPPPGYVAVEGLPITVLANAEADALFREVETCISSAGYTVQYPASWHTNAPSGDVPACSWFAPEAFDVTVRPVAVKRSPPDGVWIAIEVVDGAVGYTSITPIYMSESIALRGYNGHRAEFGPSTLEEVSSRPEYRAYHYVFPFDEPGATIVGGTDVDLADDYALAKAVLDRIMASMTFSGP